MPSRATFHNPLIIARQMNSKMALQTPPPLAAIAHFSLWGNVANDQADLRE